METAKTPVSRVNEQTPFNPSAPESSSAARSWHVSYRAPLGIVSFLLLGIAFGLAHHFYYSSLDGDPVAETTSQEWAVRIGTGLAVLAKACLVASAAISFQQHYWRVLRSRPISVSAIDDLMGLLANPVCFFNWEVLKTAWSSVFIALAIWCIPLSTLVPPASLTTALSVSQRSVISPVPIVNWSMVDLVYTGGRGEFSDAAQSTYRVITASAYSGSILPMTALHPNYTYTLTFQGPRLRCGDVKNDTLFEDLYNSETRAHSPAFGKLFYNATNPRISDFNYSRVPQEIVNDIWFVTPSRNFTCETWNATYTATFSFISGVQSIDVTNFRYDHRFNTTYDSPDGNLCPFDFCAYNGWLKALAGLLTGSAYTAGAYGRYTATTRALQTSLVGCPELTSAAEMSGIIGIKCPGPSLERAVEALSQNATLSYFGSLPSVYRLKGNLSSAGVIVNATAANITTTPANLTISTTELVHTYNARSLLLSYSAAVLATILILLAGFHALWTNGISHSSSFSGIVRTTRNRDLDTWTQGHYLGSDPLPEELGKQKLQYGLLRIDDDGKGEASGARHAAFGFPGTVVRLRKGDQCT